MTSIVSVFFWETILFRQDEKAMCLNLKPRTQCPMSLPHSHPSRKHTRSRVLSVWRRLMLLEMDLHASFSYICGLHSMLSCSYFLSDKSNMRCLSSWFLLITNTEQRKQKFKVHICWWCTDSGLFCWDWEVAVWWISEGTERNTRYLKRIKWNKSVNC